MYFVTISEMLGSGGEKVARKVAEQLNYPFYAKEELFRAAQEMGYLSDVPLELKSPHLLEKYFSDKPKIYIDRFESVIYKVATKGDAVFFGGKGSQLLLHNFDCALHVLIAGSMENRIARLMQDMKIERSVAEKIIHTSDHDKAGFVKFAFNEDWLNPHLYDITINTDKLSIESAVNMVISSARAEEIKSCGADSLKKLGRLALQRKIEATLMEAGVLSLRVFFDLQDRETVRLHGIVNTDKEKEDVERALQLVTEIKKVINDLVVFKYGSIYM